IGGRLRSAFGSALQSTRGKGGRDSDVSGKSVTTTEPRRTPAPSRTGILAPRNGCTGLLSEADKLVGAKNRYHPRQFVIRPRQPRRSRRSLGRVKPRRGVLQTVPRVVTQIPTEHSKRAER